MQQKTCLVNKYKPIQKGTNTANRINKQNNRKKGERTKTKQIQINPRKGREE